MNNSQDFLIFKVDVKNENLTSTYVEYEIYNPCTFEKVDLSICKDISISINTPVNLTSDKEKLYNDLNELGYNLFDSNDSFYNNICSKYKSQNGTDMILSDRRNIIFDNSTLCQNDCIFISYNSSTKKAKCYCNIQEKNEINENMDLSKLINKTKVIEGFYNPIKNSNFKVMKCYVLLFNKEGQKKNLGSWIILSLFIIYISLMIIYFIKGQIKIDSFIQKILQCQIKNGVTKIRKKLPINNVSEKNNAPDIQNKKANKNKTNKIFPDNLNLKNNNLKKKPITQNKKKSLKISDPPKKRNTILQIKKNSHKLSCNNIFIINNKIPVINKKSDIKKKEGNNINLLQKNSSTYKALNQSRTSYFKNIDFLLNNNNILINNKNNKHKNIKKANEDNQQTPKINFNNEELNNLEYE